MTNGSDKTAMAMARRLTNQLFTAAAAGKMVPTTPPTPTKKSDTYNTPEIWGTRYKIAPTPSVSNPHNTRRRAPHRSTAHPANGINSNGNKPVSSP